MKNKYKFTIFTPTYNRASTIKETYESICEQNFNNIEWIIVDDGSTDNTKEIINSFINSSKFNIRYIYKENGGVNSAFNIGINEARGELFIRIDSDDSLVKKSLYYIDKLWSGMEENIKDEIAAIYGLSINQSGRLMTKKFPQDRIICNIGDMIYKNKISGEFCLINKTSTLKEYNFPSLEGEKFIPEGVIWIPMGTKYKVMFINEIFKIYNDDLTEESRITSNLFNNASSHCKGKTLYYLTVLNENISYFWYRPKVFIVFALYYIRYSLHSKYNLLKQITKLEKKNAKYLGMLMIPFAYGVYLIDKNKK